MRPHLPAMVFELVLCSKCQSRWLESTSNRIIPTIEKAEERNDRDNFSHLLVVVILLRSFNFVICDAIRTDSQCKTKASLFWLGK